MGMRSARPRYDLREWSRIVGAWIKWDIASSGAIQSYAAQSVFFPVAFVSNRRARIAFTPYRREGERSVMNNVEQELIGTALPYWEIEAAIVRRFFANKPSRSRLKNGVGWRLPRIADDFAHSIRHFG